MPREEASTAGPGRGRLYVLAALLVLLTSLDPRILALPPGPRGKTSEEE